MIERTEELALDGLLPIQMGGQRYELRTLTLVESDAWLNEVAAAISGLEMPDDTMWLGDIGQLLTRSAALVTALVASYDKAATLGGLDAIRERMTKRELKAAMDAMVTAEDPFGTDVARSAATAFGLPSHALALGIQRGVVESRLASLTAGPLPSMASDTASSESVGAASSSSSDGPTTTSTSAGHKRSG